MRGGCVRKGGQIGGEGMLGKYMISASVRLCGYWRVWVFWDGLDGDFVGC